GSTRRTAPLYRSADVPVARFGPPHCPPHLRTNRTSANLLRTHRAARASRCPLRPSVRPPNAIFLSRLRSGLILQRVLAESSAYEPKNSERLSQTSSVEIGSGPVRPVFGRCHKALGISETLRYFGGVAWSMNTKLGHAGIERGRGQTEDGGG